jgi:phytanoyl-CoA hydroxylase
VERLHEQPHARAERLHDKEQRRHQMKVRNHTRNLDFVWRNHSTPLTRLSEEQAAQYDEKGFVVLEDVFPHELMDQVAAEIDPIEDRVEKFLQTQPDGKLFIARAGEITFATNLVKHSETLVEFVKHPAFAEITHDLVGPDVRLYWDQSVYKKPGTDAPFPWHQDNGYTYLEPQQYLTCWVALTDATPENGCPWVLPGLHKRGTLAHETTDLGFVCVDEPDTEPVVAPVRKGGIVVFSSLTPHSTGPNRTDGIRKSYIVQFAPDGAVVYPRGLDGRESDEGVPANEPDRQFPILVGGVPAERD